jgi:hypothetical protein
MPANSRSGADFERLLADSFRRVHWRVRRQPHAADLRPDLIVEAGRKTYAIELKRSAEGRRDRLIPLLSQAVLQARAIARQLPGRAVPVAVVAAERVSPSVAEEVKQFGAQFAPETGVGIIDAQGLRAFAGHGLEVLDAQPPRPIRRRKPAPQHLPHLFSDLNSWMLKTLLGQSLPESLISIPRAQFRNASQLASAARVSVMSASRFVRQLENEGFLDDRADRLELVRVKELLARWVAANQRAFRDIPARWIIKRDERQLLAALRSYCSEAGAASRSGARARRGAAMKAPLRCAAGLFAAAGALGFGFVHGVPPYIYMERLDPDVVGRLGLSLEDRDRRADAYIRVPANQEAVFRAAVMRDGLPVSDILQVWLDASTHPARGREQADEIRKRVLGPLLGKAR